MSELDKLREEIDRIDSEIVKLFSARMDVSEKIGQYKRENSLPVLDASREDKKLSSVVSFADDTMKPYVKALYGGIFTLSRKYQHIGLSCRKAEVSEMKDIRLLYRATVDDMKKNGGPWDEIYPDMYLSDDIRDGRLWILERDGETVAAFVLSTEKRDGDDSIKWIDGNADGIYLCRICVRPDMRRNGYGTIATEYAEAMAKSLGYNYLRLYVLDNNNAAQGLYEKCGYIQLDGLRIEEDDDGTIRREYGYIKKI